DGQESIKAIDESLQAAVNRYYAAKTEAEEKAASEELQALRTTLVDRALKLAQNHRGSPEAVDALTWVIRKGRAGSEPRLKAIDTLRREYLASDRLGEACRGAANTIGNESLEAERLLREAIEKSPHRNVRGWATFGLAEMLENRAEMVRDINQLPASLKNWI